MLIYLLAVAVALWLIWDYHRKGHASPLGYVYAVVGLCLALVVVVRSLM